MPGIEQYRDHMTIAGIGAVTGYGWGADALWRGLLSGVPAARPHPGYGPDRDRDAWVALVPDGGDPAESGSRYVRAVTASARAAVADAEARGWRRGERVGLIHGIVLGDVGEWADFHAAGGTGRGPREFLPMLPPAPVSAIAREFGFHGPAVSVSAACSTANVALITARHWLAAGIADDVLCVSSDLSVTPALTEQFVRLGVAVTDTDPLDACRPFQEGSRGYGMAEASVGFLLTRAADRPYAAVLGGAMTNDAHHLISIDPGHEQILACARLALRDAGVDAAAIAWFNAHGPGTAQSDAAERDLLHRVFADRPGAYSIKPLTGHCQGAAGAVEVAAAALGYERGVIPAPPIVAPAHPRLLDGPTPCRGGLTAKLSLGMGGNNSMVVLGPPDTSAG